MEMPSKIINPINQPKLNTNFTIPIMKPSIGIQKRNAIIRPFKILPFSSTRLYPLIFFRLHLRKTCLISKTFLSLNDAMEMPSKTINPINQPKLNTNFITPKMKHSNGIQKRKAIIRPFKILPFSSTRQHLDSETIIVHQSANSVELETKIAIQVKMEQNINTRKPPKFDTSLN